MSLSAYRVFETKVAQTKNQKNRYWNLNARLAALRRRCLFPAGAAQCVLLRPNLPSVSRMLTIGCSWRALCEEANRANDAKGSRRYSSWL